MPTNCARFVFAAIASHVVVFVMSLGTVGTAAEPTRKELDFFETKIRPLLIDHCYECHSHETGESEGDLFLDTAFDTLKGGAKGPALRAGHPDKSLIIRAVEYNTRDLQMPPDNKLPAEAIVLLREWIEMGAPDPRTEEIAAVASSSPMDRKPSTHWAFVSPKRPKNVPKVATARDPIDAFAFERATEHGVPVAGPADRQTLVRRLYFDLTGLPPTKAQVDAFVLSHRPNAFHRLVDRLIATPEFAERFGRHWLDVARYADTVGYALGGKERRIKGSDRFRDWTIRAFATDMPYDEMIVHQLAGDRTDRENKAGNLDAMGFLTIGRRFLNGYDTMDDRIDVITRGLLGLTVACARCHDHKFDPIPASDYYSLLGILESSATPDDGPSPLMMVDKAKPHDTPVLLRGQPGNRGPVAPRRFLASLRRPSEPRFTDGSGRMELAQRIVANDNPLTARVMVNRVWMNLTGKPLVDSPSDFGFRTQPPGVPEVLDELAVDFASHWSIKRLVRRIVMTRIYQQSAIATEQIIDGDPGNRLLTRANRRRRDFESLRDSMLFVSDSLDQQLGGDPVEISLPSPVPRRSIYAMIDRQNLPSLFRTFDFASPDTHSPMRYLTTVPQQALYLLNGKQSVELARRAAVHIRRNVVGNDREHLVDGAFQKVLARQPSDRERQIAVRFLARAATPATASIDSRSLWKYGTGGVDGEFKVLSFTPLPVFKDGQWRAGKKIPVDGSLGYASLTKENGHPGRTNAESVIRRYVAPADGEVRVLGVLGHRGEHGDGIRATIWAGEKRIYSSHQQRSNTPFGPLMARVTAGEHVDIVASPGESDSFDSFFWRIQIKLVADDDRIFESDSTKDFSGPFDSELAQSLGRLAQLVQSLMMSNEFAFVD